MKAYKLFREENGKIFSLYKHLLDNSYKDYIEYSKKKKNKKKFPVKKKGPFCAFLFLGRVDDFVLYFGKKNIKYSLYQIEGRQSSYNFVWEQYDGNKYSNITTMFYLAPGTVLVDDFKIIKLVSKYMGKRRIKIGC